MAAAPGEEWVPVLLGAGHRHAEATAPAPTWSPEPGGAAPRRPAAAVRGADALLSASRVSSCLGEARRLRREGCEVRDVRAGVPDRTCHAALGLPSAGGGVWVCVCVYGGVCGCVCVRGGGVCVWRGAYRVGEPLRKSGDLLETSELLRFAFLSFF